MSNVVQTIHIRFRKNKIEIKKSFVNTTNGTNTESQGHNIENFKDEIKLELSVSKIFHKALNKGELLKIFEKNDFEVLGNALFEIICRHDEIRSFLLKSLLYISRDAGSPNRCRIYFEFDQETNDLAGLPWEYLLINEKTSNTQFYVGAEKNSKFDIVRLVPVKRNPYTNEQDLPNRSCLQVITVSAFPQDIKVKGNTELEDALLTICTRYSKKGDDGGLSYRFSPYVLDSPVRIQTFVDDLKAQLNTVQGPYVLHFFGHAKMDSEHPAIAFLNDQDEADWISSEDFASIFSNSDLRKPELVILEACESGQVNPNGEGLALDLIKAGIPAVVAMQNEVTIKTSIAFVEKLYEGLLEGKDVAEAVSNARSFLGCEYNNPHKHLKNQYTNNAFGTPVVYLPLYQGASGTEDVPPESLRLLPPLQAQEKKTVRMMQCPRCRTVYQNPRSERCTHIPCRREYLVLYDPEKENAGSMVSTTEIPLPQPENRPAGTTAEAFSLQAPQSN